MHLRASGRGKSIVDREMLMQQKTCAACGQTLTLGEPVVLACVAWAGPPQWIHEKEAVYDAKPSVYVEKTVSSPDDCSSPGLLLNHNGGFR